MYRYWSRRFYFIRSQDIENLYEIIICILNVTRYQQFQQNFIIMVVLQYSVYRSLHLCGNLKNSMVHAVFLCSYLSVIALCNSKFSFRIFSWYIFCCRLLYSIFCYFANRKYSYHNNANNNVLVTCCRYRYLHCEPQLFNVGFHNVCIK